MESLKENNSFFQYNYWPSRRTRKNMVRRGADFIKFRILFFHDNYSFNSIPASSLIAGSFLALFGSLSGTFSGVFLGYLPETVLCGNSRETKRFGLLGAPRRVRFGCPFWVGFGFIFGIHFGGLLAWPVVMGILHFRVLFFHDNYSFNSIMAASSRFERIAVRIPWISAYHSFKIIIFHNNNSRPSLSS